ncbi:MAG: hypothetical protein HOW97_03460 [Catenulispora sp.]|nr:hypothetical protein [Catenulispora sp.]NUR60262.1 hypothetical protein [Catenulispora sp.]
MLALLIRTRTLISGLLAGPLGYPVAATLGGALLYVVMMYAVAPALNTEISDNTARAPFFLAHLLFGAVTGAFVYWRAVRPRGAAWAGAPTGSMAG